MASFPTTLKNFISKLTGGVIEASHINDLQDEVSALETKVGVNNSSVTTSLDYLVKNTASVNPGHKHSTASISNFDLESPTNGQVPQYNSTSGKWEKSTVSVSDASTTVKGVTKLSVAPVTASDPIAVGTNDTRLGDTSYANKGIVRLNTDANTSGLTVSSGVVSVNTGTGANQIVKLDGTGRLPAVDGSQLTNIILLKKYTASNNIKLSSSAEKSVGTVFSPVIVKTFFITSTGTIRVGFENRCSSGFNHDVSINVNGVSVYAQTFSNTSYTTRTTDITLSSAAGSTVDILITNATAQSAFVRNVQVSFDVLNLSDTFTLN
jgi:hypothetical protein